MIAFIAFTILASYFSIKFGKDLKIIAARSSSENIALFGKVYQTKRALQSDFSFIEQVFSGKLFHTVPDEPLQQQLKLAQRHFRLQFFFGICAFVSIVVTGAMNA